MSLQQYVQSKYNGKPDWFIEEIASYSNASRIQEVAQYREYLDGEHNIKNRSNFMYNGQLIEPRKIVINLAKTIINFKTQYLLKNPVTFIGNERMIKEFQKVNKLGKFDTKNEKILSKMLKYGQVYEYIYVNKRGHIDSKIIDADEGTPVFNRNGEMIAFIEHYTYDGITYWILYTDEIVQEWSDEGGEIHLVSSNINVSGLPILYMSEDETSNTQGRSELKDYINILDNMEDVMSKFVDSMYKFMNPIPVVIGQELKDSLPSNVVGGGFNLDDGADFKMVSNQLDSEAFDLVYKTLQQTLLDVSATPAVSMNKTDISNLSEVSIKLLFSLADTSAGVYENYMLNGFIDRYHTIAKLLNMKGIKITEKQLLTLDFKFTYNTPSNHKEILDNMKTQFDMGAISTETIIENSPYVSDGVREMLRLNREGVTDSDSEDDSPQVGKDGEENSKSDENAEE